MGGARLAQPRTSAAGFAVRDAMNSPCCHLPGEKLEVCSIALQMSSPVRRQPRATRIAGVFFASGDGFVIWAKCSRVASPDGPVQLFSQQIAMAAIAGAPGPRCPCLDCHLSVSLHR